MAHAKLLLLEMLKDRIESRNGIYGIRLRRILFKLTSLRLHRQKAVTRVSLTSLTRDEYSFMIMYCIRGTTSSRTVRRDRGLTRSVLFYLTLVITHVR
jgi:hypothetical protein